MKMSITPCEKLRTTIIERLSGLVSVNSANIYLANLGPTLGTYRPLINSWPE